MPQSKQKSKRLSVFPLSLNAISRSLHILKPSWPSAGRDIYNWTAKLPTDTNGVPLAPAGVNANEFTALLRTNLLTELLCHRRRMTISLIGFL